MTRSLHSRIVVATVALSFASCSDEARQKRAAEEGDLYVEVNDVFGSPIDQAAIRTQPETEARLTDETGSVLISHVAPGYYLVAATHDEFGAASDVARVQEDELTSIKLVLEGGSGAGGTGGTGPRGGTGGTIARGGTSGQGGFGGTTAGTGGGPTGEFIDVATQVEAMVVDPTRPYLYALDRVNNDFLFINLETKSLEKTIFVGSSPVDLDFNDDMTEAYVANFGSTEIAVVDLDAQEVGRTIFVDTNAGNWDGNPYRLAVTAFNTLVFTSEDQWQDLKLVNASNGGAITAVGTIYSPDLAATADGTTLFVAESGGDLYRYSVTEATLMQVDATGDGFGGGDGLAVLTGDEQFVFYGRQKILTSNLASVVGEFSDPILATNDDGSLAVSASHVYDGNTFGILALTSLTTQVLALSTDARTLYLYDIATSRIYIQDLSDL
jgi:DNA-binding beta-propeller fold protein YncE